MPAAKKTDQKKSETAPKPEKEYKQTGLSDKDDDWRTTIDWEVIYRSITILVLVLVPFFVYDMIKFRDWCDRTGRQYLSVDFILKGFISAAALAIYRNYVAVKLFYKLVHDNINPKFQGTDRTVRSKKVVKWGTDIVYYGLATIYGFVYFKNETWFPFNLDKDWSNQGFFEQWPNKINNHISANIDFYLTVQFGQHIYALLELVIVRRKLENKFWEWCLHHVLALTLIFYSVFNNFYIPGVVILLLHDIGDIVLAWFKLYGVFRTDVLFYINTANMIISWFITRIFIYLKGVIFPFIQDKYKLYDNPEEEYQQYTERCYIYMLVLCFLLQIMHLYWFATMLTMLWKHLSQIFTSNKRIKFQNDFDFHKSNQDAKSQKLDDKNE